MAIKASFPSGKDTITVSGLYQWDYGQILEIEAENLPAMLEVHFAYQGLAEAIVRSCSVTNNVGTVTIPNLCLEQSSVVTAWIYEISNTLGHTIKTVNLPITARTRPGTHKAPPEEYTDKYTELISEVSEAIDALQTGKVVVERAAAATNANYASASGNASTATHASSATQAETANYAKYVKYANNEFLAYGRNYIYDDPLGKQKEIPRGTTPSLIGYFDDFTDKLIVLDVDVYAGSTYGSIHLARGRTLPFTALKTTYSTATLQTTYSFNIGDITLRFYTSGNALYGCAETGTAGTDNKYYLKAIYEEL